MVIPPYIEGQWHCRIDGAETDFVILNIDRYGNCQFGSLSAYTQDWARQSLFTVDMKLLNDEMEVEAKLSHRYSVNAFYFSGVRSDHLVIEPDPATGQAQLRGLIKLRLTARLIPKSDPAALQEAEFVLFDGNSEIATGKMITNPNERRSTTIKREQISWEDFKRKFPRDDYRDHPEHRTDIVFRGQRKPYRLRTTMYRTRRFDMQLYTVEDIKYIQKELQARRGLLLDPLNNRDHLNELLAYAQHYEYPTPLLDWTFSPYVAAFFAFRHEDDYFYPTIFVLEMGRWAQRWYVPSRMGGNLLELGALNPSGESNGRAVPQKSVLIYSNCDPLEALIEMRETPAQDYLTAYKIHRDEREVVLNELRERGITEETMFPDNDNETYKLPYVRDEYGMWPMWIRRSYFSYL